MKLAILRSDAPRDRFPVFISNSGRSHDNAHRVAADLSEKWDITIEYVPDPDDCKQGTFYLDATDLTDLEVEGVHHMIKNALRRWPVVYDLAKP